MRVVASGRPARLAVALAACVLGAWIASSLPEPPPVGIPDPGLVTRWGIPVATVVRNLSASTVIGLGLTSLLMRSQLAAATHRALGRACFLAALSSAVALSVLYVLTASDVYSVPVTEVLAPERIGGLYRETEIGTRLVQQLVLWLLASALLVRRRPVAGTAALGLAVVSLVPWAYGGHSAGMEGHQLAVYSVLLHLLGVTVWVGGVTGLVCLARLEPARTVLLMRRFSPVALAAFGLVAVSGAAASWVRVPDVDALWGSGYGRLIVLKTALLIVLGGFGAWHRRTALGPSPEAQALSHATVLRMVAVEALVMAGAMGVAVALSRTPMS